MAAAGEKEAEPKVAGGVNHDIQSGDTGSVYDLCCWCGCFRVYEAVEMPDQCASSIEKRADIPNQIMHKDCKSYPQRHEIMGMMDEYELDGRGNHKAVCNLFDEMPD